MKKLLIIALLFWGCDYAPTEHTHDEGVCVRYSTSVHSEIDEFTCYNYPELTHKDCLTANYTWYSNITCEEFCEEKWNVVLTGSDNPDSSICYIQDEMPIFLD